MRKVKFALIILPLLAVILISLYATARSPEVVQACRGGTGEIRIEPHGSYYPLPVMLKSPATFNVSVQAYTAYSPRILLIMTNASYQGLTGPVVVQWIGGLITFQASNFTAVDSGYIPPSGTTPGARYMVPSLKEHIGVNGSEDDILWYAFGPFLGEPITTTPQTFNVTLPSTNPRMLVYALGKSKCSNLFDMRVPPTRPGFVVPDAATVLLALASFSAFGVMAIRRRKEQK